MNNVMIDIETLGTRPGSVILSLGAVFFDPQEGLGSEFYMPINLQSSLDAGLVINAETLRWWLSDGRHGELHSVLNGVNGNLPAVLTEFTIWLARNADRMGKLCTWGCGAGFDQALLKEAYARCNLAVPWAFWNERCYRTLKALYPEIPADRTNNHNALEDAKNQALHAIRLLR